MSEAQWTAVDDYINDLYVAEDAALTGALEASVTAGMPQISVAPNQGKLLHVLALSSGARKVLEIGTLGGYSTIWLARALPEGGKVVTLEADPKHAEVATANIAEAGLSEVVEVRVGKALDTLPLLADEGHGDFDLVFIDADKVNTPAYLEWALKLTHRGSLIITDNVVRGGKVVEADADDPNVQGVREFHRLFAGNPRITATAIQTVGSKGYDGLAIGVVTGE
jgi:predicted O-methyltransferase YrrM